MQLIYRTFTRLGVLIAIALALVATDHMYPAPTPAGRTTETATSSAQAASAVAAHTEDPSVDIQKAPPESKKTNDVGQKIATTTPEDQATRIKDPYPFPARSFDLINTDTRAALVNILCMPRGGTLRPITGSGVLIDPRGVILTNAHVAQYVLLSQSQQINLTCFVRTGSPARALWSSRVLYIPPVWVGSHASEINTERPSGTGEHDYALLLVDKSLDGSALPASFPYIPVDTREAIAFEGDDVLVASYPAEFVGGIAAQFNLFAASSVTTIGQLLTFHAGTVDLLSLGGVIEAQGGSSGGAAVNAWGRLVGIITTTSSGQTTAERDLRAISLSYIDRDLLAQTTHGLDEILGGDVRAESEDFNANAAPDLLVTYLKVLTH